MSWYGDHAKFSKAEVKQMLPPGACKRCIYWFRVVGSSTVSQWGFSDLCPRCGIHREEIFARLTGAKSEQSDR